MCTVIYPDPIRHICSLGEPYLNAMHEKPPIAKNSHYSLPL
jgi:hypothetical protein